MVVFIGLGTLVYQQIKHCGWYSACDPNYYEDGRYHNDWRAL